MKDSTWKFIVVEIALIIFMIHYVYIKDKEDPDVLHPTIRKSHISFAFVMLGIIVTLTVVGLGYFSTTSIEAGLFVGGFIAFVTAAVLISYKQKKANERLMQECATELQYLYEPKGDPVTLVDSLYKLEDVSRQKIKNIFSGFYAGYPIRTFDYNFWFTYGKTTSQYSLSFFEIQIGMKFPTMLITSKEDSFTSLRDLQSEIIKNNEVVDLEGNFSDYFSVLIEPDKQMEIRQILTPDMMVYLIDTIPSFSFLFTQGRLLICYKNNYSKISKNSVFSKEMFTKNIATCQYLVSKWLPALIEMDY